MSNPYSAAPMFSMGTSQRGDEMKAMSFVVNPGPGSYNYRDEQQTKLNFPSWKMGSSVRNPLYNSNKAPGPGSYDVTKNIVDGPVFGFGTAERAGDFKDRPAVGPGSYNPKKTAKTYPAFSMGYRPESTGVNNTALTTPGPGNYPLKSTLNKTAPKFGTSTRNELYQGNNPVGPGTYYNVESDSTSHRFFAPKWKIGTGKRDEAYSDACAPGPGKYDVQSTLKTKGGFSVVPRRENHGKITSEETPGPGTYKQSIDPLRHTAPAFRIGKSERKNLAMGNPDVPAPGTHYYELQPSNIGAKIGTSERPGLHPTYGKQNPGPGTYDIDRNVIKGPKYAMGIKCGLKKNTESVPGPGAYDPFSTVYMEKNTGALIGTSERPGLYSSELVPGPGMYKTERKSMAPKYGFGTAKRNPTTKSNEDPGPGSYNLPQAFGNVPRYLLPKHTVTESGSHFN